MSDKRPELFDIFAGVSIWRLNVVWRGWRQAGFINRGPWPAGHPRPFYRWRVLVGPVELRWTWSA